MTFEDEVRRRVEHSLSFEVAACAGMRLDQLQQFVAGAYRPSVDQLFHLARRLSLPAPPAVIKAALAERAAKRRAA
jgi:hypothetical protein